MDKQSDHEITFLSHLQYPIWDFGWLFVREFSLKEPLGTDVEILEHYIESRAFRVKFLRQFDDEDFEGNLHGPFEIPRLAPSLYREVSPERLKQLVEEICDDDEFEVPPTLGQREVVREVVSRLTSQEMKCFHLDIDKDDERYRNELHWVFVLFHDFVFLDTRNRRLISMNIGYD